MSEGNIENITKWDSNFGRTFVDRHELPNINFNSHCLVKNNIFIPKKLINIYISDILNQWSRDLNIDFTLGSYLFGSVKLTKNVDLDIYKYSDYGIGFNYSEFSFTDGSVEKMSLFLKLVWADLCILIIKIKLS